MNSKDWRVDCGDIILDEDGNLVACAGTTELARQIVDEHNEHLGLTLENARLNGRLLDERRASSENRPCN